MDDDTKREAFDSADFYDLDPEADRLVYTSVVDAVEESLIDIDGDGSVTVYAWSRGTIPLGFCLGQAGSLLDWFMDSLVDNDLADPDDGPEYDKSDEAVAIDKIAAALEELVSTKPVWACERSGERTFTRDELRALVEHARTAAAS